MLHRTLMWQVGSFTMKRRASLSCCGKYARIFILSDFVVPLSSWRSKNVGYAANYFLLCCLLHTSVNVELGVGKLLKGFARSSGVARWWGCEVAGVWCVDPPGARRGLC